jgi:peptidoglycan hydrolase-like protein with peptidoglycan-binding domain
MSRICCYNVAGAMCMVPVLPEVGASISASVGAGGVNRRDDVQLIQTLLNAVWCAPNRLALLAVDGLVGPKTIGGIKAFQTHHFGSADGRADPGKRTIARLNVLASAQSANVTPPRPAIQTPQRLGFAASSVTQARPAATAPAAPPAPPPTPPMTPLQAAIEATPRAIGWVTAAIAHMGVVRTAVMVAAGDMKLVLPFVTGTVNTHFHLDREPTSTLVNIDRIVAVYKRMLQVFADPGKFYSEGPETANSPFADASVGGINFPNVRMTFRTKYPTCGPNVRAAMLVHEGAHFCGAANEIGHFAMEFPAPAGKPQDGSTRNYEQLTTSEAMRNASSYAAFAIHAFFMQDLRFGAADLTK